ncbi:hypothetical protein UJ101_01300 [Flavobacteriaceae bacterium UJ101]|nr:hypothetical protein UJ101_01300 [Flavobacteriaceae bacterium UJ101]
MRTCFYIVFLHFVWFNFLNAQIEITSSAVDSFSTAAQGDYYITTDTNELYVGLEGGTLRKISNPNEVTSLIDNTNGTLTFKNELNISNTINKANLVDNGDGTYTFSNATGTSDDVTFLTNSSSDNQVVSSTFWIDTTAVTVSSTSWGVHQKSFVIPGNTLGTGNAVRIVCYRINPGGSTQIRLSYGGQTFYTSGNIGNNSSRMEFIIFGNGTTNSQKSFMDDANTGGNGQRFGVSTVDSTVDQTVSIQIRKVSGSDKTLDFCSAEKMIISTS